LRASPFPTSPKAGKVENAPRRNRAELQQKQRLQSIIFPFGVTWDGEAVRTRETARVFGWIDPICDDEERLVTPSTCSWNQFSAFIEEWDELRMTA
jgi:hypothetical protein